MHRHLGDNRMLVAGGLLDQPAHQWFAVQYAGWLYQLLEKQARADVKPDQFTEAETDYLIDVVMPIRMERR
mgnify:CR=1 FL=1